MTRVVLDRGFGFIETVGMADTFFNCRSLDGSGLEFDEQLTGRRVRFKVAPALQGPRALRVEPA